MIIQLLSLPVAMDKRKAILMRTPLPPGESNVPYLCLRSLLLDPPDDVHSQSRRKRLSTLTKGETYLLFSNKIRRNNLIQGIFTHMNECHKHKQSLALNTLISSKYNPQAKIKIHWCRVDHFLKSCIKTRLRVP